MKNTLEKLTFQVQQLIEREAYKIVSNDNKWKLHYKECIEDLEFELDNIEEFIIDSTECNLPINKIEQEGYKRAIMRILNMFKEKQPQGLI